MLFHYDHTAERTVYAPAEAVEFSPGRASVRLVKALDDWFGIPHRTFCRAGECALLVSYPSISFPVMEYAEAFGYTSMEIGRAWPLQAFGTTSAGELTGLKFSLQKKLTVCQQNLSGRWQDKLDSLCLYFQLPDAESAQCLAEIFRASGDNLPAAAMDWKYAAFLQRQQLSKIDRTFTYCYVSAFGEFEEDTPELRLAALTMERKRHLWKLFLEKRFYPPEFEWLWSQLIAGDVSDWTDWVLSCYQVLEELHFEFVCHGSRFELLDGAGRRIYFGVDAAGAAERVLMKVLFPLNR